MCSDNTLELGKILAELANSMQMDLRDWYFFPLLDDLNEWLDQTYG